MTQIKQALTIATSDSGGGAGIQADIKAMSANGVYATSVIVALTAQNTQAVTAIQPLPISFITAQIDAIFDDFEISAAKTGMLFSAEIVRAVAGKLKAYDVKNLVVDPVMISKGGAVLLQDAAIEVIKTSLFPMALVVTPNVYEAQRLSGVEVRTIADAKKAARIILEMGPKAVVVKGGHLEEAPGTDLLLSGKSFTTLRGEFYKTNNTHGTGCTFSSAIAAQLARGRGLIQAVRNAKRYTGAAIRHSLSVGRGHGPTHHFYALKPPF